MRFKSRTVFLALVALLGAMSVVAQTPAGRGAAGRGGRGGAFTRPSVSVRTTNPRNGRELMTRVLGWRLGARADGAGAETFWSAAANADAAGLSNVEGVSSQRVSEGIPKPLDWALTDADVDAVVARLDELRLRMAVYRIASLGDDDASRRAFVFAKRLGAETVVVTAGPAALAGLDALAAELDLHVAVRSTDTQALVGALASRSERMGLALELREGAQPGDAVAAALAPLRGRTLVVDPSEPAPAGTTGRDRFTLADLLVALGQQQVPSRLADYPPPVGHDGAGAKQPLRPVLFTLSAASSGSNIVDDLKRAAAAFDDAVRPAIDQYVDGLARLTSISSPESVLAAERQRIAAAIPMRAPATRRKSRTLLVLDLALNGSFYHGSTALGNLSLKLMSERTGAFTPVFSNDLANLHYPRIEQFDAVFLNQIQGSVFDDDLAVAGLTRFVREGGGVAGLHAATWASPDVPEFGDLMGATSGAHKYNGEMGALRVDDARSPLTRQFEGRGFEFLDEFYHYVPSGPYTRDKLHVLLSLDPARHDLPANQYTTRPDNDYGMVWIREYGKGRVFNCGLGHRPEFYEAPAMQQMMLAGIQFVLGDLDADATPSGRSRVERRVN